MAKALFGHVVAPAELRVAEENAALRAKVRRLEQEVARLRAERDAHIASELLSLTGDSVLAAPVTYSTTSSFPPARCSGWCRRRH